MEQVEIDGKKMGLIACNCPNCGGIINISESLTNGTCQSCGTQFIVNRFADGSAPEIRIPKTLSIIQKRNVKNLLTNIFFKLEDGEFDEIPEKVDEVLDVDANNGEAFLALLMAELRVNKREELANLKEPFNNLKSFERAYSNGYQFLRDELDGYINEINTRNSRIEELTVTVTEDNDRITKATEDFEVAINELVALLKDPDWLDFKNKKSDLKAKWHDALQRTVETAKTYSRALSGLDDAKDELEVLKKKINDTKKNLKDAKAVVNDVVDGIVEVFSGVDLDKVEDGFGVYADKRIEWTILKEDEAGKKALLISKKAIECKAYFDGELDSSLDPWGDSALRKWLNGEFIEKAFTKKEQKLIKETTIQSVIGDDYKDKVFILSEGEVKNCLNQDNSRYCVPTQHAKENGIYMPGPNDRCYWWLRKTDSSNANNCSTVNGYGQIDIEGVYSGSEDVGVRPAIWVNIL